jgi:SAM-dependent methyltransferase
MKATLLSKPGMYHYLRQGLTGGMPFRRWIDLYGFNDPHQRIADLGCGPADMLRYIGSPRPEFYLGVDISAPYLDAATKRAESKQVSAEFVRMDLDRLAHDDEVQTELVETLEKHQITRVLLLGVMHHINDESALTTLDLARSVPTVNDLLTSDVVYVKGHRLNNKLCDWDRGEFVRDEAGYDALVARSSWYDSEKVFTSPRFSFIKYIHYRLTRSLDVGS